MLNPELKEGDRILLIHMDGESSVTIGEKGTVLRASRDPFEEDDTIYTVKWDNGSTLNLLSVTDSWVLDKKKESIQEAASSKFTNCSQFTTGRQFCEGLTTLLKGTGKVKKQAINFFNELQNNIDLTGAGQKVKLEPGNSQFEERYTDLVKFYEILKSSGQCTKMLKAIEKDLESVREKGLVMVVDNDEKYSLFNRLNTHYTNQAIILTHAFLKDNAKWKSISEIDTWKNDMIEKNIMDFLEPTPENLNDIDSVISELMDDDRLRSIMLGHFDYAKGMGDIVESEVAKAFRDKGYEVFEFGGDFGFVDHFGVDMVVMKDGVIHPVQASSQRKMNPKFFTFNEPNCKCWAVFPYGGTYRVETLLENSIKKVDELMGLQRIFQSGKGPKIFDFFESIRKSGIVNMLESSKFAYSGGQYLKDFVNMQKYSGYDADEDVIDELAEKAEDAKYEMIRITMDSLETQGKEPSLQNMNREIQNVAREALRYFIMIKSL